MNISFEKLEISYLEEVLNGLCYSFAKYEPTSVVLDLDNYDLKCVFEPVMKNCLNTSFIAKDKINNKIAGAIICNDYNYFLNLDGHSFNQKGEPVGSLLASLENSFQKSEYYIADKTNHTFYQYATYVNDDYNNKGIATSLYKISEEYALEYKYKNILTISTGPISQHIRINKLGFKCIDEIAYSNFQFNGVNIFSKIKQVNTCKCLIKILNI